MSFSTPGDMLIQIFGASRRICQYHLLGSWSHHVFTLANLNRYVYTRSKK
jgi:hypothetical protein